MPHFTPLELANALLRQLTLNEKTQQVSCIRSNTLLGPDDLNLQPLPTASDSPPPTLLRARNDLREKNFSRISLVLLRFFQFD
ncbi:hypothetical protein [Deinococcus cellulosilyticus]|nr:hypothetical protein [Deinococcus cellulosilyticus]